MKGRPDPAHVLTGPFGLVGRGVLAECPGAVLLSRRRTPAGLNVKPILRVPPVDVTDQRAVKEVFRKIRRRLGDRPLVAIHMAALTDTKLRDASLFERVNVRGTRNVLKAALSVGAYFIHVSTDYVFAGCRRPPGRPYRETDRPRRPPPGDYAASKFRAEAAALEKIGTGKVAVARIAFPYGGGGNPRGLEEKIRSLLREGRRKRQPARLFNDQIICPSYIPDAAKGLVAAARKLAEGSRGAKIYHLVGGPITPYRFGRLVRDISEKNAPLRAATVKGAPYARNLWLSSAATRRSLGWSPAPHERALKAALKAPAFKRLDKGRF